MTWSLPISLPIEFVTDFCRRWKVAELSIFGSVLGPEFTPESDVDFLVAFEQGCRPSLEQWIAMEDELRSVVGREVDLVERRMVINPFRRHHILTHRRILYAA